jgi:hypothetical protein
LHSGKYIKSTIRLLRRHGKPQSNPPRKDLKTKTQNHEENPQHHKTNPSLIIIIIIPTLPHPLSLLTRQEDPPISIPRVELLHRSHLRVCPVRDLETSFRVSLAPESGEDMEFDHHLIGEFRITELEL